MQPLLRRKMEMFERPEFVAEGRELEAYLCAIWSVNVVLLDWFFIGQLIH